MTIPNFLNVVQFKLKYECIDQHFEIHEKFTCEGLPTDILHKRKIQLLPGMTLGHLRFTRQSKVKNNYIFGLYKKKKKAFSPIAERK